MADYNINAVTRKVSYTGSAGVGPYAFSFEILAEDDVAVYFNTTLLTLTTDYSVTINANGTGSVTIVVGTNVPTTPDADDTIIIVGARDIERTTDFVTAGDLRAAALNEQLDSGIIFDQQISERVDRALAAPIYDPTGIDMTLPAKADRAGTVLGFNATTGNPEAGPTIADVSTLAAITADIATLADIEDGTDATDAIQTVAANNSNVTTVAGISGNVTTVAGISSDVTAVAADATDIGTVSTNIANVNTVAGISSNVTTVASNNANVTTVADNVSDVNTVAGISSNVSTVAGISADVTTVAADGTDIGTVATNIANVNTVAGISGNVTTVAGISANVTAVAGDEADIGTVATNISNVNTVAGINSDVTTVAGISANVTSVAADATDIGTVATNMASVNTVAGNSANVTTVAGISSDVTAVANISGDIQDVQDQLTAVQTVADDLQEAVSEIETVGANIANVNTVAGISSDVTTAAGNSANITTVAGISGNVTTVAGISANVTAVAGDAADIGTVATDLAGSDNIGTVAGSISNVNAVGGAIADVSTVATNLSDVQSFANTYRIGATDPTVSLDEGDLFFNTTDNALKYYDGASWASITAGLTDIVGDATPQLGGNLDTNGNDITFGDNDKAIFGAGSDLQIYHDGSNSYVEDSSTGAGELILRGAGNGVSLRESIGNEPMLTAARNGAVTLYYDNSAKLATISSGVNVTGSIGINESSPSAPLHITTTSQGTLPALQADADNLLIEDQTSGITLMGATNGGGMIAFGDTDDADIGRIFYYHPDNSMRFWTNAAERMRIDSSGDLLVGKTANDTSDGVVVDGSGYIRTDRDSSACAYFNRKTNDGDIVVLRKNNTSVGSIGVDGGDNLYLTGWVNNTGGIYMNDAAVSPAYQGVERDNYYNLGKGAARWKDLYLSGYVRLTNASTGTTTTDGSFIGVEGGTTALRIVQNENDAMTFHTSGLANERMRIDPSGNFHVACTSHQASASSGSGGYTLGSLGVSARNGDVAHYFNRIGTDGSAAEFRKNGSIVGSVSVTSSGTTYNTTSDARLKTDIQPIADATDRLMQMNPVSHKWVADPEADAVVGFIAQEMQEIVPEAVSGDADSDEMMSMDYGRITPVLVAALQEATKEIQELKARVAELEAK